MFRAIRKDPIMAVTITPSLRTALQLDAAASGAMALLAAGAAPVLSPLLGLPQPLLFWAGIALLPWVALLLALARRGSAPRLLLVDVIALNALWVAATLGLLASGLVEPTMLGVVFVVAQAMAVAAFAALQRRAFRRSLAATTTA
jgi:hypothetical protein